MTLPVAILAGGFATRLGQLTKTTPKSLVTVAGKPFIAWQLDYLQHQGIKRVVLCVGHLGAQIKAYIKNSKKYDLEILFSFDGISPLGTGGALKRALPLLGDAFFVLYGDSYLSIALPKLESIFYKQPHAILMTMFKNDNQLGKSNVLFKNGVLLEYNKHNPSPNMHHIDYGVNIIKAAALNNFAADETFDLASFYHHCSLQGNLCGYEVFSRFYEIGTVAGWQETTAFLSNPNNEFY